MALKTTTVTLLVDNEPDKGLATEHGLSMWIEHENRHILFDTGQKNTFAENAGKLGVDIGQTETLVLSHGHFDHTGGIPLALRMAPNTKVYCHPAVVYPRYSVRNGAARPIQMPEESKVALDRLPSEQLHWVQTPVFLSEGIGLTGFIPRKTDYEDTGGPFYLDPAGRREDAIDDDMALWIRTEKGLVVCVGCSHAGLVNTLNHIQALNKGENIHAVIGGFHLIGADVHRLDETVKALRLLKPDLIAPCHCTGKSAAQFIQEALGKRVVAGKSGMTYRF